MTATDIAAKAWDKYQDAVKAIRADQSLTHHQRAVACCKAWNEYSRELNAANVYPSLSGYRFRDAACYSSQGVAPTEA